MITSHKQSCSLNQLWCTTFFRRIWINHSGVLFLILVYKTSSILVQDSSSLGTVQVLLAAITWKTASSTNRKIHPLNLKGMGVHQFFVFLWLHQMRYLRTCIPSGYSTICPICMQASQYIPWRYDYCGLADHCVLYIYGDRITII